MLNMEKKKLEEILQSTASLDLLNTPIIFVNYDNNLLWTSQTYQLRFILIVISFLIYKCIQYYYGFKL